MLHKACAYMLYVKAMLKNGIPFIFRDYGSPAVEQNDCSLFRKFLTTRHRARHKRDFIIGFAIYIHYLTKRCF